VEKEADVALTIPALVAERIAAHGNETVLRKKDRGIWQAVTWTQLGSHVADVSRGLATIGFGAGDVACVLAETRPDYVYVDLGILDAGGVSGGIHPAIEPEQLGDALQQSRCSVLFVENEEQLDKALLVRDRCAELQRIIIFDMKGLREFSDAMCESYRSFIARGTEHRTDSTAAVTDDQPAILLLPQGRLLTHGDVLHLIAQGRSLLQPRARDERLALLPMCSVMEHVFGLYLALDAQVISNYLESPDTVLENLQEVQPTLLGADTQLWQLLYARATAAADGATRVQRSLYRWAIGAGGSVLPRVCVLNAVRRELGLGRVRCAYVGATKLPPEIQRWTSALGIDIQQIDGQATQGVAVDARYRALMEEAYGT
jgi:long-chain acyl-CoA synthetase